MNQLNQRYFMSYSTANEDWLYRADWVHFSNLARLDPGVPLVEIFIAISKIKSSNIIETNLWQILKRVARKNPKIKVHKITFKDNIGRDFSSAAINLRNIAQIGNDEDYILFVNRSGYGPLEQNWYSKYIDQYKKFAHVGLCGSTINFCGHPKLPPSSITTHVQTYVYLTQLKHLLSIKDNFPGEKAQDRLMVIEQGEIGLSKYFLENNLGLTCLIWPDKVFTLKQPNDEQLPQKDIKKVVTNIPFRYKFSEYLFNYFNFTNLLKLFKNIL